MPFPTSQTAWNVDSEGDYRRERPSQRTVGRRVWGIQQSRDGVGLIAARLQNNSNCAAGVNQPFVNDYFFVAFPLWW